MKYILIPKYLTNPEVTCLKSALYEVDSELQQKHEVILISDHLAKEVEVSFKQLK